MTKETVIEQVENLEETLTVQQLKDKLEQLNKEEQKLEQKQQQLMREEEQLEKLRLNVTRREDSIQKRELNAELEFVAQQEQVLSTFQKKKDQLQKEYDEHHKQLQKKLETKRREINQQMEQLESELERKQQKSEVAIEKYRRDRIQLLEKQYNEEKKELDVRLAKHKQDMEGIIREKEEALDESRKEVQDERLAIQREQQQLSVGKSELQRLKAELTAREEDIDFRYNMLEKDRELFDELVKEEIDARIEEKERQFDQLKQSQSSLMERLTYLQNELDEKERLELRIGSRSSEDLLNEIEQLKETISLLKKELQNRPTEEILIELEEKARKYDELYESFIKSERELQQLQSSKHRYEMSVAQLQIEREKYEIEVKRREVIQAQIEKYVAEVNRLKALHEQPAEVKARIGVIENPHFTRKEFFKSEDISEIEWLNMIEQKCNESGLRFNKRLFYAFHTALKTSDYSPLTVLAGVSGTGKSELPRLYSRFGGLYYLPLAVQPDWDSPQALFGYFNSVDNRFNATPLVQALIQFQEQENPHIQQTSLGDSLLLVLLDEMNLAHVELYFSELLSKLETRRGEENGVHVDIDLGAGMDKYQVLLNSNVFWVGTMNEDETTKSLSDKVIDRGNLISFPRPKKFERRLQPKLSNESPKLCKSVWNKWLKQQVQLDNEIEKYKEALEEINMYLEKAGRALGHRVWQSVENYIANHPLVIQAKANNDDNELDKEIRKAFEEALVHKVMPKLRGIEVDSGFARSQCLNPIAAKIREFAPGLSEDFELAMTNAYRIFIWRSAKYLEDTEN
ncbi:hypothetical protein [Ectobacillus funiculus]|uniref:hypothetical protein n=1 Tax=Ectobacillus funiculus TaxID=137993 RepID=UPI00101C9EE2|nr:hypothetical protein [Ectobacillus funiculus]